MQRSGSNKPAAGWPTIWVCVQVSNQVFQLPLCSWLLGVEHHELHRVVAQPTAENHKLHHRAVPVRDTALVSRFEQMALLREAGPLQPLLLLLLPPVQLMLLLQLPLLLRVLWVPEPCYSSAAANSNDSIASQKLLGQEAAAAYLRGA